MFFPQTCRIFLRIESRGIRRQSTSVRAVLTTKELGKDVKITGWINHKRKLKNATFLDITDGSCYKSLQVVASETPDTYIH